MSLETTKLTDEALYQALSASKRKRDEAFGEIYARYSGQIYLYCRKILSDQQQVEDVFQETFLRLLKSAERDREMTNLPAYLLRISRNLCLEQKRRELRQFVDIDEIDISSYESSLESKELETILATALETLPAEHKEAFILQAYNGLSYSEIANVTDVPVSTVRNRVVRAKHKIREIVSRYFLEDPR